MGVDRVKFPSNLGALLRAAAVLGADSFFFVNGSADPLSWKVIVGTELTRPVYM